MSERLDFKAFHDCMGDHPSQTAIFHSNGSKWWMQVAAGWSLPDSVRNLGYLKRRSLFRQFIEAIDFTQLQLLDDTVTKIALTLDEQTQGSLTLHPGTQASDNYFMTVATRMRCTVTEDPDRVIYPPIDEQPHRGLRQFKASHLQVVDVIDATVSIVLVEDRKFAYKSVDRPIYLRGDTEHLLDELDALVQFSGEPNVAQLIGLVVSESPYKTCPSADMASLVITGLLLEYYPGGSLEDTIQQSEGVDDTLLVQWALQIGEALAIMHLRGRAHVDMKPANVVLDAHQNAILIDIGGTGGFSWEWLSPEMSQAMRAGNEFIPTTAPFKERVATDCWAYGRILLSFAGKSDTCTDGGAGASRLHSVARRLTEATPEARMSLSDALTELRGNKI
ncbi:uncharacterized protein DSM5745_06881 [Aspergillus mulundensis]|uniref:Protein kinase domain-containing protein n=1 Tax=Aspergillus mulundensis TaxID=1810919 RepID=A0A3D8RS75_9EURO|nr:hypothetical protein DSM5745_06881 [Aspergillus mulundensis]RDW76889.1 hypothetical protein DSM5745_06881 [Aspergillus mulundensis]